MQGRVAGLLEAVFGAGAFVCIVGYLVAREAGKGATRLPGPLEEVAHGRHDHTEKYRHDCGYVIRVGPGGYVPSKCRHCGYHDATWQKL